MPLNFPTGLCRNSLLLTYVVIMIRKRTDTKPSASETRFSVPHRRKMVDQGARSFRRRGTDFFAQF